jgi:hypothetical protein
MASNSTYFVCFRDGGTKKHKQPTMKHNLIVSLRTKLNVLISSGTLHYNVNLSTEIVIKITAKYDV